MTTPKRWEKVHMLTQDISGAIERLGWARLQLGGEVLSEHLIDARSELSKASNSIDDAMGLIDELMAPEPTREEVDGG